MRNLYPCLLLSFVILFTPKLQAQVDVNDSLALVALYNSTDGPNWSTNNWLTTQPVRTWSGVTLDSAGKRVTVLGLGYYHLNGTLPKEIGNLTKLTYLDLQYNQITNIPPEIGNLTELDVLYLNHNKLAGSIPPELGNCTKLGQLYLNYNNLTGSIPYKIGNLTQLYYFDLAYNNLSGSIPPKLGKITELRKLWLNNNQLSGSIPPELGNLAYLQYFYLNNNELSGSIPPELGNFKNLFYFDLSNNNLSGSIPPELGNLASPFSLDLSNNNLSGAIPAELSNIQNLGDIYLEHNKLTGTIPESFSNLVGLYIIDLSFNKLQGSIPSSFSALKGLSNFNVHHNKLSGPVPTFFENLKHLKKLDLRDNHFTFDGIETLALHGFDHLKYAPQKEIYIHQKGNTLSVYAGGRLSDNTYKWYNNGVLAATKTGDSTYTPATSGDYFVNITNAIATELTLISDTVSFGAGVSTAIAASLPDKNFSVYPNPAKTFANISFNGERNYILRLSDANGKVLQTRNITAVKGLNTVAINLSNYTAGEYFITLTDDKLQGQTLKLNKQ